MQIVKLTHNGNSLGITVPAEYRRQLGWYKGQHVFLSITESDALLVRRIEDAPQITASDRRTSSGKPSSAAQRLRSRADRNRAIAPPKDPRT